jgi:S-adenosylmethionine/arginine decarboxylase-like enzyme
MLISWGKHFIIDANQCSGNITNIENINNFINDLCRIGKMEKKGGLIVENFPDIQYNRERDLVGYSVVQIISLSNITLHINFISKTIYFDFFTCGELNEDKITNLFRYYFIPETIKTILLNREAIDANVPFVT